VKPVPRASVTKGLQGTTENRGPLVLRVLQVIRVYQVTRVQLENLAMDSQARKVNVDPKGLKEILEMM
jgi:hypothetical protein